MTRHRDERHRSSRTTASSRKTRRDPIESSKNRRRRNTVVNRLNVGLHSIGTRQGRRRPVAPCRVIRPALPRLKHAITGPCSRCARTRPSTQRSAHRRTRTGRVTKHRPFRGSNSRRRVVIHNIARRTSLNLQSRRRRRACLAATSPSDASITSPKYQRPLSHFGPNCW